MSNKNNANEFQFLSEAPIESEQEDKFSHSKTVEALVKILNSNSCPHTIGLFSEWGTGKSGVIKLLSKKEGTFKIIEFDAWKYRADSFRRQLVLKVAEELSPKDVDDLESLFNESWSSSQGETMISIRGALFLILSFLVLFAAQTLGVKFQIAEPFSLAAGITITLAFLKLIFPERKISFSQNRMDLPEQFEREFVKIIKKKKRAVKNLVIVVDNLDRIESEKAREVLSTLKTFLNFEQNEVRVTFLIPCDHDAIKDSAPEPELAEEFLKKIFNIHFWLPEFIEGDLENETRRLLKATNIEEFTRNKELETVINAAFRKNPRQIKQFINNLVANLIFAKGISEVAEVISQNTAFLAKVLIIKEKFPEAYQRLKQFWHDERKIIEAYEKETPERALLSNFLADTDHITSKSAEPFIYFKKPKIFTDFDKAEELNIALIKGNTEAARTIIESCTRTQESSCLDLIIQTLKNHETFEEVFHKIYTTQLKALENSQFDFSRHSHYFKQASKYFRSSLGDAFIKLPPNLVFDLLVHKNPTKSLVDKIILKYITALRDYAGGSYKETLLEILKGLIGYKDHIGTKNKSYIAEHLAKPLSQAEFYELIAKQSTEIQEAFVSEDGLEAIFKEIFQRDNIYDDSVVLGGLKELIKSRRSLDKVWEKMSILSQRFSGASALDEWKETEFLIFLGILEEFEFGESFIEEEIKDSIIENIIQTYTKTDWSQRKKIIQHLNWLRSAANESQRLQIHNHLADFFQHRAEVSAQDILDVIKHYDKEVITAMYEEFSSQFKKKIVVNPEASLDLASFLFKKIPDEQQQDLIAHIVQQLGDGGVELVDSLKKQKLIHDFEFVMNLLIDKFLHHRHPEELKTYVFDNLSKNSPRNLKEKITQTIIQYGSNANTRLRDFANELVLVSQKFINQDDKKSIAEQFYNFWMGSCSRRVDQSSKSTLEILLLFQSQLTKEQVKEILNQISANLQIGLENDQRALTARDLLNQLGEISFNENEDWLTALAHYLKVQSRVGYKIFLSSALENLQFKEKTKKVRDYKKQIMNIKQELE